MQIKLEALVCVRTGAQGAKASVKLKGRARRIGTVKKIKKVGLRDVTSGAAGRINGSRRELNANVTFTCSRHRQEQTVVNNESDE